MAKTTGVIVTGVKELEHALRQLELKLQNKLARQAIRKAAKEIVLPQVLRDVPVATGQLRSQFAVRALKRAKGKVGAVVGSKSAKGDQFYGSFLEFGTKVRRHKSGKSTGRVEPNSHAYLRKALYDNQTRIRELFVDDLRELLREAGF